MDIPKTNADVGACTDGIQPSLVRVACALRGILDAVITGSGEPPAGLRNLLEFAEQHLDIKVESDPVSHDGIQPRASTTVARGKATTCRHSCSEHAEVMDISVWSRLPEELMEVVFARLPWPLIYQVRTLSKGWNRRISARDSGFLRACGNAQPKMFGLLSPGDSQGSFRVDMFDIKANRWHAHQTSMGCDPSYGEIQTVRASDGGLVCFVSKSKAKSYKSPLLVLVCNPLTQAWRKLPPLFGLTHQTIMVQLIMDRERKQYRVIVVPQCNGPKVGSQVNVYHSGTGQWTRADFHAFGEVVYGYLYNVFNVSPDPHFGKPWPYIFGNAQLLKLNTVNLGSMTEQEEGGRVLQDYLLVKDHLLVLNMPCFEPTSRGVLTPCWISEYEGQGSSEAARWTRLREYNFNYPQISHQINELPSDPIDVDWEMKINACKDFLVLIAFNRSEDEHLLELLWLLDLSTSEWHELPMMPKGNHLFLAQDQMCELCCDAVP